MDTATVKCAVRTEPDPVCSIPCFICLLQEPKNISNHRCNIEKCGKLEDWLFELTTSDFAEAKKRRELDLIFELFSDN